MAGHGTMPRLYTKDEREFFRSWRDHREPFRPEACKATKNCWVEIGPPAMNSQFRCAACGGTPTAKKSL